MNKLIKTLQEAERVVVLTGAGVSAESGIPTFRDAQTGMWKKFDPGELATPSAFKKDPQLVWDWYMWRRELIGRCEPNAGHYALVELAKLVPKFTLITQNVDGLHEAAGSVEPIELHGSILKVKCFDCEKPYGEPLDPTDPDEKTIPRCPHCNGYLRPDVVWFEENLSMPILMLAQSAAEQADVLFSIGTSSIVYPAAVLPHIAQDNHATVVEINPHETELTPYADYVIKEASGVALPQLVEQIK